MLCVAERTRPHAAIDGRGEVGARGNGTGGTLAAVMDAGGGPWACPQATGLVAEGRNRSASGAWYRDGVAIVDARPTSAPHPRGSAPRSEPTARSEDGGSGWTAPGGPSLAGAPTGEWLRGTRDAAGPRLPAASPSPAPRPLLASWLGRVPYRPTWLLQKHLAAERAAGNVGDRLLLLEHEPVLTLGRHADPGHVLVSPEVLAARGIELLRVERGGEVTYHGPGQLVAYPIVGLAERGIGIRDFVRILEEALAVTCAAFGVAAGPRVGQPGCWCDPDSPLPRKIGALGLRVERGVTYHGIALNVDLDLTSFELIDPCGLPGLRTTSIAAELARLGRPESPPSVEAVAWRFARALAEGLGTELAKADLDPRPVGIERDATVSNTPVET